MMHKVQRIDGGFPIKMQDFHSFSDFETFMAARLSGELPGRPAHSRMASAHYKEWPEPLPASRSSAVLILFYPYAGGIGFPVILRPVYNGVHSGQVAFPGGKADPGDKDLYATALREAWEEIRAPYKEINILGSLSEIYIQVSDMRVMPVIGTLPFRPEFLPDPREVQEIREIGLSEILDKEMIRQGRIPVRGGYIAAPFYHYNGLRIWGATAMMISELSEIIEG